MKTRTDYHTLKFPCNWVQAKDHAEASKPGIPKDQLNQELQVCPCCYIPIQKNPLSINFSLSQIAQLGHQYPMYFQTIKLVGLAICFMLLNTGLFMMHDALSIPNSSSSTFQINLSPIKQSFSNSKFAIVSLLGFLFQISILFMIKVIQSHRINTKYQNDIHQQISQTSILLKNVPKGPHTIEKIKSLFTTNFDHIQILNILLIHDWSAYQESIKQMETAIKNWKLLLKKKQRSNQEVLESLKVVEAGRKKVVEIVTEMSHAKDEKFCGNAIIIFSNNLQQTEVLNAYKKGFFNKNKTEASLGQIKFDDAKSIVIEAAPLPSEIYWINISESHKKTKAAERISIMMTIALCAFTFLLYFLGQLIFGRKIPSNQSSIFQPAPIGSLVLLSIFCYLLAPKILKIIQKYACSPSQTQHNISLTTKYMNFLIISKFAIVFLIECIFCKSIPNMIDGTGKAIAYGTVISLTRLFIVDSIVVSLLQIINPRFVYKKIMNKIGIQQNSLSQPQANTFLSQPEFPLVCNTGYILSTFCLCFMFLDIVPFTVLIVPFSLLIYFWVNKWNFSRRSSIPSIKMSKRYTQSILNLIEWSLVMKPLFNVLIWSMAAQQFNIPQIFMLILALAYVFIPKTIPQTYITKLLKLKIQDNLEQNQEKQLRQFRNVYHLYYPILSTPQKMIAYHNKINLLHNNKKITVKDYKEYKNQCEKSYEDIESQVIKKVTDVQSMFIAPINQVPESDRNLTQEV